MCLPGHPTTEAGLTNMPTIDLPRPNWSSERCRDYPVLKHLTAFDPEHSPEIVSGTRMSQRSEIYLQRPTSGRLLIANDNGRYIKRRGSNRTESLISPRNMAELVGGRDKSLRRSSTLQCQSDGVCSYKWGPFTGPHIRFVTT